MAVKTTRCASYHAATTRDGTRLHCHSMVPLTTKAGRHVGSGCTECGMLTSPSGQVSDGRDVPRHDPRTGKVTRTPTRAHLARVDAYYRAMDPRGAR